MKKIRLLFILILAGFVISCTQPSAADNNNNNNNNKNNYAENPEYCISFKINDKECFIIPYSYLICNEDYSNNNELKDETEKAYLSKNFIYYYSTNKDTIGFYGYSAESYIHPEGFSYNTILKAFPSTDGKIRISDIKINFYFNDQFYSKKQGDTWEFKKEEKVLPDYYLNNKGSNTFILRDGNINNLFIIEGKSKSSITWGNNFQNEGEITKTKVNITSKYFEPENIWKNKNSFNNISSYIYNVDFIYKKYSYDNKETREHKIFEIDLKNISLFKRLINNENVIFL